MNDYATVIRFSAWKISRILLLRCVGLMLGYVFRLSKRRSRLMTFVIGSRNPLRKLPDVRKFVLSLLLLCSVSQAFAATTISCVKGLPEPKSPIIPKMRPIQTAQCSYSFDDFIRRLTAFAANTQSFDSVETLRAAFGLPDMITGYDDTRIAAYALDVSGKGGWTVRLGASEGFYPTNKGPARFLPGPHPKRLDKVANASLQIDVLVSAYQPPGENAIRCVTFHEFQQALVNAGWTQPTPIPASDGESDSAVFEYANKHVSIQRACSKRLPQHIMLWQKPTKP